ncbi:MAG: DEAD/DEAH box helicase, partial [Clostridiaceae bacterium]|nr:DEAD/DEAH box helicase [Clostridiaceae bacterium]
MTSDDKDFTTFVERWMNSSPAAENITHVSIRKKYSGKFADLPNTLHPDLVHLLKSSGIDKLYEHQKNALAAIENGKNTLLTTGPSSGKSLTYIIPIINDLFSNRSTNALLIFPTKALAYDQFQHIQRLITSNAPGNNNFGKLMDKIAVYDGDTPKEARSSIRKKVKVLITNPDMLHIGILPNHSLWENYFESLKFIIVDEAHIYHGIFGSHVSNVIRRLKRVMLFYQTKPHFICTTATIGNPEEFIHALIEEEFLSISDDRSPQGERKFIFYNPPIIQKDLGIRASTRRETLNIADTFFRQKAQTLIFQRSRKEVEKSFKLFKEYHSDQMNVVVAAYRSGYLANDRRNLEERFQSGEIKILFSTNALELGIDIGGLKCVILSGYPGSISSTLQQIGRSGRKSTNS